MYYANKIESLRDIFGKKEIRLEEGYLNVDGNSYPIVNDVIILLDPSQYPQSLNKYSKVAKPNPKLRTSDFAEEIQYTFGKEWEKFQKILPENEREFFQYFDMEDLSGLKNLRVCDVGCGNGRWSYFLSDLCRELILIDFSEAIFMARRNLAHADNALFFMADLKILPFRIDFTDFLFCLGVLHHLPTPALDEIRMLNRYAPRLLIYLYYILDNRPFYYQPLLGMVDRFRRMVSKYRNSIFRTVFTWLAAVFVYRPIVFLGILLRLFGFSTSIPLYESYEGKTLERIKQDVYDRFFTPIEQRHSKKQIMELEDTFSNVLISDQLPYWHFVCQR